MTEPTLQDLRKTEKAASLALRAAGAGLVLAAGWNVFGAVLAPKAPESDRAVRAVANLESIDAGLREAAAIDFVLPLTFSDGKIDILFVGAPECRHCRDFVDEGLGELVSFARAEDLDLAYMPLGMSGLGLAIAAIEHCALPQTGRAPEDLLRIGYDGLSSLQGAARETQEKITLEGDSADARSAFTDAMKNLHTEMGGNPESAESCRTESMSHAGRAMTGVSQVFEVSHTPSFYFDAGKGNVARAEGSGATEIAKSLLER